MKTKSEGEAMKREYEKPRFSKAAVTLQAVTAIANTTGNGIHTVVTTTDV